MLEPLKNSVIFINSTLLQNPDTRQLAIILDEQVLSRTLADWLNTDKDADRLPHKVNTGSTQSVTARTVIPRGFRKFPAHYSPYNMSKFSRVFRKKKTCTPNEFRDAYNSSGVRTFI